MKITKKLFDMMKRANNLQEKQKEIVDKIEEELSKFGVDVNAIREDDEGGYVDMVDYGRGIVPKEKLEQLFSEYKQND